jgi:predicted DNA-binding transcriptional regulator AlpA
MNAELASLPDNISRKRVLSIEASAEFIGVSINTCRRMYGAGTLPRPVPLNARKLGYQVGTLIDWLEARKKPIQEAVA